MRRLCIYVLYDSENIIDNYISRILLEMKLLCEKVVVIINTDDMKKEYSGDLAGADKIIMRQNRGYDAGAYKDCFCKYIKKEEWSIFDEIILMNDSFYGPIYPIENSFSMMENIEVEFWGMTKHAACVEDGKKCYPAHVQSYFLVLRRKVVQDESFYSFWRCLEYSDSWQSAVFDFEIGLNIYLNKNGFRGMALTELFHMLSLEDNTKNPYMMNSLELIRDIKIPFFKRKSLDIINDGYKNALMAFKYLEDNKLYDVDIIKKHIERKCREDKYTGLFNFRKLNEFYNKYDKIYIYGAGLIGRNLGAYFDYNNMPICGYLVSKISEEDKREDIILFDKLNFNENIGIIIAVGRKEVVCDILDNVKSKYNDEQIMIPNL